MKRKFSFVLLAALLARADVNAQMNVGGTEAPDASAQLQIASRTKGLRLPPVSLSTTTTFTLTAATNADSAKGMLVYNTNAGITSSNATYPAAGVGTYVWDGTGWSHSKVNAALTTNIYNADGSLTGPRMVTQAGNLLNFSGTGNFAINSGNVGIGTTTPFSKIQMVDAEGDGLTGDDLNWDSYTGTNLNGASFFFRHSRGTLAAPVNLVNGDIILDLQGMGRTNGAFRNLSFIQGFYTGSGTSSSSNLRFATTNTERMRIDSNGNVGIGITNPAAKLEVNGTAKINSVPSSVATNLSLLYADGNGNVVTTNANAGLGAITKWQNATSIAAGATGLLVPSTAFVEGAYYRVTIISYNSCIFSSTAEYWVTTAMFNNQYGINAAGGGIVTTGGTNKSPVHTQNSTTQITTTWPGAGGACLDGSNNTNSYYVLTLNYTAPAFTLNITNNSNITKSPNQYVAIVQRVN